MNEAPQHPHVNLVPDEEASSTPYPTPDNPPWNGWVAVGVWLLSVLLIVIVPFFFLAPYLVQQGVDVSDKERVSEFIRTDQTAIILQLAPTLLTHALTFLICWFVVTRFKTYPFREMLGWRMNGFKVWYAFAILVVFYAVALILQYSLGEVENEFKLLLQSSRYAVYLIAFFATFTAPLVEEVVYRGILYSAFKRKFGVALAVCFVTLLFTIVHVPQYSIGAVPDYATIITLLLLSLTLTGLRVWTGNLLPCIVLHTVINGVQSTLLIAEPYIRSLEPVVEPTAALFR